MKVGALILAAGASTRLGSPKQLATIAGETLLDRTIRVAREAACAPVVVVLGAFEETIQRGCQLQGVKIVSNSRWSEGMGTSLAAGVKEFAPVDGIIVMTCDMPSVTAGHLRSLSEVGTITCSVYQGVAGVPAFFPKSVIPDLAKLGGDQGARHPLHAARRIALPGGSMDIDSFDDLRRAREVFG